MSNKPPKRKRGTIGGVTKRGAFLAATYAFGINQVYEIKRRPDCFMAMVYPNTDDAEIEKFTAHYVMIGVQKLP